MTALGQLLWFVVSMFVLLGYLAILFQVVADLFRDTKMPGWGKAIWMVALIFLPVLTALVYVIARGPGMAARRREALDQAQAERDAYIRRVAGARASAIEQIAMAKSLLDAGAIDEAEFRVVKSQALGNPGGETERSLRARSQTVPDDAPPPIDEQH